MRLNRRIRSRGCYKEMAASSVECFDDTRVGDVRTAGRKLRADHRVVPAIDEDDKFSVLLAGAHWPCELVEALEQDGCELDFAPSRPTAMMLAKTRRFHFLVVQASLVRSGFPELCEHVRSLSGPGAIVVGLGANMPLSARLEAYGASGSGVDTWMDNLHPREILARIERAKVRAKLDKAECTRQCQCHCLEWLSDKCGTNRRSRSKGVKTVGFSPSQRRILMELMGAESLGLRPEELCIRIWGSLRGRDALRVQIYLIRKTLSKDASAPSINYRHGMYRLACGCRQGLGGLEES